MLEGLDLLEIQPGLGTTAYTRIAIVAGLLACAGLASGQTINIRCGASGTYMASDSTVWQGDQDFTGGQLVYTGYPVSNTPDPTLYRYARQGYYGDFSYNIPAANGAYQLTLKFAEIQFGSPGERVFNVIVNGTQVLSNFDIVAQAGAWTALDEHFPVTVSNGTVQILVHGTVGVGLINAIQLAPVTAPLLQVSAANANFSSYVGGSNPTPQPVTISNTGGGTLNWTASNTQSWLTLSAMSGTAPATLTLTASSLGLLPSTYTDTVTINAGAAGTLTVAVTFVVTSAPPPPVLTVGTSSLSFSAAAGGSNPSSENIGISNSGGGTLSWTASNTQSWLNLSAASGTAPATLGVSISTAGLTAATYTDTITINGAGSTALVGVTLTVSPAAANAATFVTFDTATQGNWKGVYGSDGYDLEGAAASVPSYGSITADGASTYTWAASTSDPRALQQPTGTGRFAATWYQSPSFYYEVNLTDGNSHQFAMYALDDDSEGRVERIDITAWDTGALLDTRTLSGFVSGEYAVWNLSGHVMVKVTELAGSNAVISGIFFAPAAVAPGNSGTSSFLTLDSATQGNWVNAYGSDGYDFEGATVNSPPAYVQMAVNGDSTFTWAASTADVRALEQPSGSSRVAATWYSASSFSFNLNFTDGNTHQVALYAMDYDNSGRSETVQIIDYATSTVLDSRTLSNFSGGQFLVWNLHGHVTIQLTEVTGGNAVASGLFFGGSAQATSPVLSVSAHSVTLSGSAQGGNSSSQQVTVSNSGGGTLSWTASGTQPWITLSATSRTAPSTLTIGANTASLEAGTYTDTVTVASSGVSGSPQLIGVTLNVTATPTLGVSATTLTFNGIAGGSNPQAQMLSISNKGGGTLNWSAANAQSWLSVSPGSGSGAATLTASISDNGLNAGTYTDTITVTAPGAASSPQTVGVTLNLSAAPPALTASPSSVNFTAVAGGANPTSQSIKVSNTGGGTLNWAASNTYSWLTLTAASGTAPASIGLNISTAGLGAGTYTDTVTVTAAGVSGSPQMVAVTLTVTAAGGNAASFIKLDTTTQGNWPNVYGTSGYDLIESASTIPSYAQLTVNGAFIFTWAGATTDTRALETPAGSRLAATWYAGGSFNFDLNLTDGLTHQISLYAVDYDNSGRSERIDIIDATSGSVLDTRTLTSFQNGQYPVWNIAGHVTIQVTQLLGPNAVISAVFFDPAGAAPVGSSQFEKLDTTTLGNWENAYGGDGYSFVGAPASLPGYATVGVSGAQTFGWAGGTSDARALEIPNSNNRVAGAWYATGSFSFNISMNDGNSHQVALYALDYDNSGRSERIDVIDSDTGVTLDSRTIGSFTSGEYLVWNLEGNILINITQISGTNAVVSGIFFGRSPLITTPETLSVSSGALSFSAVAGGSNPGTQGVTITNAGIGTLSWTAMANQPWLTLSAGSGTAPSSLSIGAAITGLSAGTYTADVTISAPGALQTPQSITVTLNIRAQPAILSASPAGLTFATATAGTNPATQPIAIMNAGTGTLSWTAAATQSWVTLSATSGTAPSSLSVGVSTAGLTNGVYTDTLLISAAGASGSPASITITLVVGQTLGQHYVSPQGSPTGDGSINNPWDLQTALFQPASVLPGDTIWVRGGTYGNGLGIFYSNLVGTADLPIIVKQFPGERATIDGWLQVGCCDQDPQPSKGQYVWFWGLEFASSVTNRTGLPDGESTILDAVDTWAPGTKFIDNIVHDSRVGISMWKEAVGSEAYGNLVYFNGFQASDRGHGHGFYVQNLSPTMSVSNNIIFDQFDNGMQYYGTAAAYEQNLLVQGNISFNNGAISAGSAMADDVIFVNTNGVSNIQLLNNYFYFTPSLGLGYNEMGWPAPNQNITVQGNYFMGGFESVSFQDWASINFQNNTVYTNQFLMNFITAGTPSGYNWDNNNYYGAGVFSYNGSSTFLSGWQGWTGWDVHSTSNPGAPTGVWSFVEPNKYDSGRANIAVYNWDLAPTVSVDISSAIAVGTRYQILDAENYYGAPVASGTYDGSPVSLPMTGLTVATPNGSVPTPPTHTAPQFGAFILTTLQ